VNRTELIKKLDDLDVPKSFYDLDGNLISDRIILYNSYNDWIVFYLDERGNRHDQNVFDSEEKALNYIFKRFDSQYDYHTRDINKIFKNLRNRPHLNFAMKSLFFDTTGLHLPSQFKKYFSHYNGLVGKIGTNTFIDIWKIEDIINADRSVKTNQVNNDLVAFSDTNKDRIFAFGKINPGIFVIKSNDTTVKPPLLFADDFNNFLLNLFDQGTIVTRH